MSLRQKAWVFYSYLISIILIAVLPLNSGSDYTLTNSIVVHIRLDHLLHGILFLPWAYLGMYFRDMRMIKLIITGLFIGISAEAIQILTPYRSFTINDMISNTIGVISGLIFLWIPVKVVFPPSDK